MIKKLKAISYIFYFFCQENWIMILLETLPQRQRTTSMQPQILANQAKQEINTEHSQDKHGKRIARISCFIDHRSLLPCKVRDNCYCKSRENIGCLQRKLKKTTMPQSSGNTMSGLAKPCHLCQVSKTSVLTTIYILEKDTKKIPSSLEDDTKIPHPAINVKNT